MKNLPKNEILWRTDQTPVGDYLVTSDVARMKYTLWKRNENGLEKQMSSETPEGFNEYLNKLWSFGDKKSKRKGS